MSGSLKDFLLFTDYSKFKKQISHLNYVGLTQLLAVGLPISVLNFVLQTVIKRHLSSGTTLTLMVLFVVLALIKKYLLPKDYEDSMQLMYVISSFILFYTIMMGTVLDPEHQALTFFLFLIVNPLFILDKPWRNIGYSFFWLVFFMGMSRMTKPYEVFRADHVHAIEFWFASLMVSLFVLMLRIRSLRMNSELEYYGSHDCITHIYNRQSILRRAKEYVGRNVAIAMVTVESLDFYTDMYGSDFSDGIMVDFVKILKHYFDEENLYQISRRKIVVIFPDGTELDIIRNLNLVRAEFVGASMDDHDLYLTFTTGYIVGRCKSVMDLRVMCRQADLHCMEASSKMRGSVQGGAYDRTDKYNDALKTAFQKNVNKHSLDKLTGLLTIRAFFSQTQEIVDINVEEKKNFTFVFFNIENMKEYNAKFGYEQGDQLIISVAQILQKRFPNRLVARFGEDHFAVLTYKDEVEPAVMTVLEEAKPLHRISSMALDCGAAVWDKDITAAECCDWARIASESIKENYKTGFTWFDDAMLSAISRKRYFVDKLDYALETNMVEVYYQPIFDINTKKIVGYEALSRWIDPEEGSFGPDRYIPILEQAHLIHKHDRYILRNVLGHLREVLDQGGVIEPVSINLSFYDFAFSDPGDKIQYIVEEYGIPKDMIRFEVTEQAFFNKSSLFVEGIQKLIDQGFEVWLDDYGGEYSSLSILLEIDFPVVKLDMMFIQLISDDPKKKHFIECVAMIAKDMKTKILCEEIEDEEQVKFLQSLGIELAQGYYLGEPKSLQQMYEEW